MSKILFIRHGNSIQTDQDTILSSKGLLQAERLAKKLVSVNISKVYVSNSTRTLQTYEAYQKLKLVPSVKSDKLKEIYRVIIGGPERLGTPPDREANDRKRADEIINEILEEKNKNIAVFTHGNFIRYAIARILEISSVDLWNRLVISDASITVVETSPLKIEMINNIEHLGSEASEGIYFE